MLTKIGIDIAKNPMKNITIVATHCVVSTLR